MTFETLLYEEKDGVAWVTLNRPERLNAFNAKMQQELHDLWRSLRERDEVRCVVLTGAGEKAFCTGIDRDEVLGEQKRADAVRVGAASSPFMFDDPAAYIGPKTCDLWKPVIAAVNGMACGGAFYLLGEVEFIIAADHATFFDPHVTYGMAAVFEPMHMLQKMPFHEIMRLSLLGNHERMSAKRAYEIGLVSEVVPMAELRAAAAWAAQAIASAPPRAIQATVRALWTARELSRSQALALGFAFIGLGTDRAALEAGQAQFRSGKRIQWKLR
ncbi:MAG: enoyl-CoA hydratase/isomerase family protein [Candidatus Binatia bacterium]|nr:enoyl-CoA hydratase/isomerase family protein [Candidatus Binatia bacterium]